MQACRTGPAIRLFPLVLSVFLLLASAAPGSRAGDPRVAAGRPAGASGVPIDEGGRRIGGKIAGAVSLSGRVRVTEDLLVLPGAVLAIAPGTVLDFDRSESSKVDPEWFFGGTELVVRGEMRASGAAFRFPGRSGGIVVDGGRVALSHSSVSGAEAGISVLRGGSVTAKGDLLVSDCLVGIAFFPGFATAWEGDGKVTIAGNGVGVVRFPGGPEIPEGFVAERNEEADVLRWGGGGDATADGKGDPPPVPSPGAIRIGETFIEKDRELSGDVVVDGVVRVAPGATLAILPGTRLFFTFRDTDGDGIGENGIFLQGNLSARGTREKPIGFHPFPPGGRGRWDSLNFMASETGRNVLENVEIAGAYRGLHAHFSRLEGRRIRIADCFRGIQFQESEVSLEDVEIVSSSSALRCRDSNVRISGFRTRGTSSGSNFFRSAVRLERADVDHPGWYGFRFRESRVEASDGTVRGGLVGMSSQEGSVRADRIAAESPGRAGFAWQDGDVKMAECRASGSLLDGVSATGGKVALHRGSITGFGRYAVKLGGPADVVLRGVDLGNGKDGGTGPIYDGRVAPGLGIVRVE